MHCKGKNATLLNHLTSLANGWVFIHDISVCGFDSTYIHLNFQFCACFEQRVTWYSGSYRMWICSKRSTWQDKNAQSNATYRQALVTQLNHWTNWAKLLSVHLPTKWLCFAIQVMWLEFQILCLIRRKIFFTFRQQ